MDVPKSTIILYVHIHPHILQFPQHALPDRICGKISFHCFSGSQKSLPLEAMLYGHSHLHGPDLRAVRILYICSPFYLVPFHCLYPSVDYRPRTLAAEDSIIIVVETMMCTKLESHIKEMDHLHVQPQ